jgi:AraC-like DNA-binding protein
MSELSQEVGKIWLVFAMSCALIGAGHLAVTRRSEPSVRWILMSLMLLSLSTPVLVYAHWLTGRYWPPLVALAINNTGFFGPLLLGLVASCLHQPMGRRAWCGHLVFPVSLWLLCAMPLGVPQGLRYGLLCGQVLIYLWLALRLLQLHRQRLRRLCQHPGSTYYWLLYQAGLLALIMVYDLAIGGLAQLGQPMDIGQLALVAAGLSLWINGLAFIALYPPRALRPEQDCSPNGLPVAALKTCTPGVLVQVQAQGTCSGVINPNPAQVLAAEQPAAAHLPAARSLELSATAAQHLAEQLRSLMAEAKPHLAETVSLPGLAELLGITPHQLSELLNVHLKTGFYDHINQWRFLEAQALMADPNCQLSLSDIAYRAGFNNRNSFYTVCRNRTGKTPGQYQKYLRQNIAQAQTA